MDRIEAKWTLLRKLVEYQRKPYSELRTLLDETNVFDIEGQSGASYCVEVQIIWDGQPEHDIRISGGIDDGGWRAFCPISYGTLISPPK